MSIEREERHLPYLITICLAGNFVLGGVGQLFPAYSFGQMLSWQVSSLLFMAGTSLYAAKLHTEKWHISSAGFILLSIAEGLIYSIQTQSYSKESESIYSAGLMVFLPGMLMICYYSGFPVWLRIFNVIAIIPFLITMVKIDMHVYSANRDLDFDTAGFIMTQVASLFWCYFAFRPRQKGINV